MIAPIDFSAMFRASVAEKLRVAGDIDEDAAEALAKRSTPNGRRRQTSA